MGHRHVLALDKAGRASSFARTANAEIVPNQIHDVFRAYRQGQGHTASWPGRGVRGHQAGASSWPRLCEGQCISRALLGASPRAAVGRRCYQSIPQSQFLKLLASH
jgi:hypothetical protein